MNLPSLHGNWVDLVVIFFLAYFISEAWSVGFWVVLADFLGFLLSLVVSLKTYTFSAELLRSNFSLPHSLSNALGFLITAGLSEFVFSLILAELLKKIPYKFWKKPWSNIAATLPALGQGLVLTSFVLTLIIGLPILPKVKSDITDSKIGGFLVKNTSGIEARLKEIFGGIVEDSLTYLTVKPGSRESIPITVEDKGLTVDEVSERRMFRLVNEERKKRGIRELSLREELVPIARNHARDMWTRKYFGHVSPEGEDVGDRLDKVGIKYTLAGENLALAPTLITAHNGLMNSEGHRANILEPKFKRLGIGVIDNGVYGKMFVQIFTD